MGRTGGVCLGSDDEIPKHMKALFTAEENNGG